MRPMTLVALFGLTSFPALAECPTDADLEGEQPIFLTYEDGYSIEFRKAKDGATVEWIQKDGESNGYRVVSWGGVFVVDEIETSGPLNMRRTRVMTNLSNLDDITLAPNSEFHVDGQAVFSNGTPAAQVDVKVTTGAQEATSIAGCDYDAIAMSVSYGRGDELVESKLAYLPVLDISVPIWQREPDGSEISAPPTYFGSDRP